MPFPKDFLWGAATASYQIEGAAMEEGRGECIWTRFSHTPGKVVNGDTGDQACDHYHLYPEDVALMKQLGLHAYRLSVSWPRVIPKGTGETNALGLDFYDRLIDELLKADIQPWVTLYHWDLPQVLQDVGGWANPESPRWFADYTDLITRRLGDRVKHWITHNEPWCTAFLGHYTGEHAPGIQDLSTTIRVAHHLLLSHGTAMEVIRRNCPDAKAGITLNLSAQIPLTDREEDVKLARRSDGFGNRWFLDPVFKGTYPSDLIEDAWEGIDDLDPTAISSAKVKNDFLGLNYYMRWFTKHDAQPGESLFPPNTQLTDMKWEVYPQGLTDMLVRLRDEYDPPEIYVTENGAAFPDPEPTDDIVEDPQRVEFLRGYLGAAEKAVDQGVPLKGYFVWSLLDNFEWAWGYSKCFGIVRVDYATQKRTLKRSSLYYQDVIKNNAV